MNIFDTHAHIGLLHDKHIEKLVAIKRAMGSYNVKKIMTITNSINDFDELYASIDKIDGLYYAIGLSPTEIEYRPKDWQTQIIKRSEYDGVIAIGETGLDYIKRFGSKKDQIEVFISHLEIAEKLNKPIIIHNRGAGEDILGILKNRNISKGIVMHCYSNNFAFASRLIKSFDNIFISFSGNVSYKNAKVIQEAAKNLDINRIVIESEAPFMTPSVFLNKRNKPEYIVETLKFIAELRNISIEELSEALWKNSNTLFDLES